MHICFITNEYPKKDFPHGGVGTFVQTLGKSLTEKGYKVSVVGMNYRAFDEIEKDGSITIHRLKPSKVKGLIWFFNAQKVNSKIKEIHKKNPIQIVETAELGLAFLNKLKGIKYIIRMHGGHHFFSLAENRNINKWKAYQEKKSFSKADHVLAVSKYVSETTKTLLGLKDLDVTIIYNPVNTNKFYESDSNKFKEHAIFFAGTIVEKKGIRQLVQALDYLIDEFPNVILKIAGRDANIPGTKLPYRSSLEKEISDRIRPHIIFMGTIPNTDIPKEIESAQLCCYPSHMEAMPLAWLEVMAMGKVFLGGDAGPGKEAVIDGKTGFLVDPHNPELIAKKISHIFNNYDEAVKIGKNGRKRVLKEFDINVVLDKNINFYKNI